MAYTPTTWKDGDIITATRMNKLEQGVLTAQTATQGPPGETGPVGPQGRPGKDGQDGAPGQKGDPGDTPYIGENGNWWIGETDTGVSATGGASTGVTSFNGRSGAVTPQKGDYTAEDVGAATMEQVNAAIQEAVGNIETALSEV